MIVCRPLPTSAKQASLYAVVVFSGLASQRMIASGMLMAGDARRRACDACDFEEAEELLHELSTMPEHPESVPINALVPIEGTPMMEVRDTSIMPH
eukprot:scaffold217059_cov33-Tisochrysis_lutea.AAC.2